MAKEKIPVYEIANLTARPFDPGDFMIEKFGPYLGRQSLHLHSPHRHVFYHLVCFTGGGGNVFLSFLTVPGEGGPKYILNPRPRDTFEFEIVTPMGMWSISPGTSCETFC